MKNRDEVGDLIHEMSCATAASVRHLQSEQGKMSGSKEGTGDGEDTACSPPIVFWGQNHLVTVEQGPKCGRATAKLAFLRRKADKNGHHWEFLPDSNHITIRTHIRAVVVPLAGATLLDNLTGLYMPHVLLKQGTGLLLVCLDEARHAYAMKLKIPMAKFFGGPTSVERVRHASEFCLMDGPSVIVQNGPSDLVVVYRVQKPEPAGSWQVGSVHLDGNSHRPRVLPIHGITAAGAACDQVLLAVLRNEGEDKQRIQLVRLLLGPSGIACQQIAKHVLFKGSGKVVHMCNTTHAQHSENTPAVVHLAICTERCQMCLCAIHTTDESESTLNLEAQELPGFRTAKFDNMVHIPSQYMNSNDSQGALIVSSSTASSCSAHILGCPSLLLRGRVDHVRCVVSPGPHHQPNALPVVFTDTGADGAFTGCLEPLSGCCGPGVAVATEAQNGGESGQGAAALQDCLSSLRRRMHRGVAELAQSRAALHARRRLAESSYRLLRTICMETLDVLQDAPQPARRDEPQRMAQGAPRADVRQNAPREGQGAGHEGTAIQAAGGAVELPDDGIEWSRLEVGFKHGQCCIVGRISAPANLRIRQLHLVESTGVLPINASFKWCSSSGCTNIEVEFPAEDLLMHVPSTFHQRRAAPQEGGHRHPTNSPHHSPQIVLSSICQTQGASAAHCRPQLANLCTIEVDIDVLLANYLAASANSLPPWRPFISVPGECGQQQSLASTRGMHSVGSRTVGSFASSDERHSGSKKWEPRQFQKALLVRWMEDEGADIATALWRTLKSLQLPSEEAVAGGRDASVPQETSAEVKLGLAHAHLQTYGTGMAEINVRSPAAGQTHIVLDAIARAISYQHPAAAFEESPISRDALNRLHTAAAELHSEKTRATQVLEERLLQMAACKVERPSPSLPTRSTAEEEGGGGDTGRTGMGQSLPLSHPTDKAMLAWLP